MKKASIIIPTYLENYNEFVFWFKKAITIKYPLKIITRDKFKEYEGLISILEHENGLFELKEIGAVSDWVNDITTAEKYIWLEYSHSSKKWKQTMNLFLVTFGTVYNNFESNSLLGFSSII